LPRSTWRDYDAAKISEGGGIFSRAAKAIPLSPEVRRLLDLDKPQAAPFEVMNAILKARTDLLWFGGIGTYIRSTEESDAEVSDRVNDAIRITGAQVRAKVIGEGANLGVTQRGRIEAGKAGVRLNTDAIDNSAGVNTSDVEVNVKIALASAIRENRLSMEARNALLPEMTTMSRAGASEQLPADLALSLAEGRRGEDVPFAQSSCACWRRREGSIALSNFSLATKFSTSGRSRGRTGATGARSPLGLCKAGACDQIRASDVPDDPYFEEELTDYFPVAMRERFAPISRRIGCGVRLLPLNCPMPSSIRRTDRCGPSRWRDGFDPALMTRAYAAVRDSFGLSISIRRSTRSMARSLARRNSACIA
jgi:glutamate dehydrogenase